ncbi:MAG: ABC transporter permease [Ardenticatenaceae bacterium]|nr:ABC transporter permease [Ardenticatenaceae bacterium]
MTMKRWVREWLASSRFWLRLISLMGGVVIWYLITDGMGLIQSKLFPGPRAVIESLVYLTTQGDLSGGTRYGPNILGHSLYTLQRILMGYFVALIVGISLGIMVASNRTVERLARPYIEFIRPIPGLSFIPLTIILLGFGTTQKVFMVFLGGFWPVLFNTINGVQGVPANLIQAGMMLGMNRRQLLYRVVLPAALPSIMTGARIGIGTAAVTVFGAEFVGATEGIGWLSIMAESLLRIPDVIVGMAFMGLIGLMLTGLFARIERRVVRWHYLGQ